MYSVSQAVSSGQQALGAAGATHWARLWDRATGDPVPVLRELSAICQMKAETQIAQVTLLLSARARPRPVVAPDQASPQHRAEQDEIQILSSSLLFTLRSLLHQPQLYKGATSPS